MTEAQVPTAGWLATLAAPYGATYAPPGMRRDDIEFLKREVAEDPETIKDLVVPEPHREQTDDRRAVTGRAIQWVRASDLLFRAAGDIASRGLDHSTDLSLRLRAVPAAGVRAVGDRVHRLPPLSAFGRRAQERSGLTQTPLVRD